MKKPIIIALFVVLGVLACSAPADRQAPADAGSGLEEVPLPNLENREQAVRKRLQEQRAELQGMLDDPATPTAVLAATFGETGRYYHAYALNDAAVSCYANARRLDENDPRWFYYAALLYAEDGDLETAAEMFEGVLGRRPGDTPSLLRLGDIRLSQNQPEVAREVFETVLEFSADSAAAQYGLGRASVMERDFEHAVEHFLRALELAPDATLVHYPLSQALRQLGRAEEAEAHLVLRGRGSVPFADPLLAQLGQLTKNSSAFLRVGATAFLDGRFEDAIAAYRQAVDAAPQDPEARKSLAGAFGRQGLFDESAEQYLVALEFEPENPLVLHGLAWLRARQGRTQEALDLYAKTISLDPEFSEARLNLASTLEELERYGEALEQYEAVAGLDPQSTPAALGRARMLTALDRHDDSLAILERQIQAYPDDGAVNLAFGTALSAAGEPARAAETLKRALTLELDAGQRAVGSFNLGVALSALGRELEAADAFGAAYEADPEMTDARYLRANALARAQRFAEASTEFAALLREQPERLPARLALATALTLDGRCVEARAVVEDGLVVTPGQPILELTLARILAGCPDERARDAARALELARASYATLGSIEAAETVAMALAESGRFEDAAAWQRRLAEEARKLNDAKLLSRLEAALELYENGKPYRLAALD